jgi:hypothetical protein
MNIELMIEGKKKTFKLPSFIPGRMVRKAVSFTKVDTNNISEKTLDDMVEYVANVYGDKFTIDEFYDGIDSRVMMDVIAEAIQGIVNGTIEAAGASKNPNR